MEERYPFLVMRVLTGAVIAAATLLPVGAFVADPAASRVEFFVRDNRGGFAGVVRAMEVRVAVREDGDAFAADVEARFDAASLTTGNGLRDSQMRREFLQTDRHPVILFHGTAVPQARPGGLPFPATLRGTLTLRGVSREVEIPLRVTALADAYLAEGRLTIRLSEFGIPVPRFLIFVAEDPVAVSFKIRLVRR
ncbi:MAG: YceI family protein [Armatimonadota bacterium]|nr:YceI family protein [Armatimonadota bacterium]MDR7451169.1 YceI family protein [Armatimonadota bacterium]MDR7467226.1 YceI family protein [Armatimonadota bacterium]MDR7494846.1 YceI family protein [Armatimonadota bacterium]MDR7500261.1 YceI family protein [Armatimonadota bacterium]